VADVPIRSIFEYDNYREYLRDTFARRKQNDKKFSFRFFARVAGFQAHSFIILVLQGKADLSGDSIEKFAKALKLNKEESEYFRNLVRLNQSKTVAEKQLHATQILKSRAYRKIHPVRESQYHYLSKWYFVVIREMVSLKEFREDPEWIAKRMTPAITPSEVKKSIKEMLDLGILSRASDGRLVQVNAFLNTPNEVLASSAAQFHRDMMKLASESIDRIPRERRELSALTVSISAEKAKKIKEMVQEFRKNLLEFCAEDESRNSIYQLNLHLFPLVVPDEEDRKE
jgi:uncharacterized protein (TIGR02147 family)